MNNSKNKYYSLDDLHEIISEKDTKKTIVQTNKLTREFFAKRRGKIQKKNAKVKP